MNLFIERFHPASAIRNPHCLAGGPFFDDGERRLLIGIDAVAIQFLLQVLPRTRKLGQSVT